MKDFLLDTHNFLWAIFQPEQLGQPTLSVLENSENNIFVSNITFWEISLKYDLGKLTLGCKPDDLLKVVDEMGLIKISITSEEATLFYQLPKVTHKDPFDRMLIWLAFSRNLVLISKDSQFNLYHQYGLQAIW